MSYGSIHRRTNVINSNDPYWNAFFDLGTVSPLITNQLWLLIAAMIKMLESHVQVSFRKQSVSKKENW